MKLAIVGAGISGLTAAYRLAPNHEVEVFEANSYLGGHTNTIDVVEGDRTLPIDTGFIVFNDRTYPNFCQLLDELDVASQPTNMSFSVQCESTGLEYLGGSVSGFFAQRKNVFKSDSYRMIVDFWRFNRLAADHMHAWSPELTVEEFFATHRYSEAFRERYFLPMACAIWSCPRGLVNQFPIRFIAEFYWNHGLLSFSDHPQWRVITGGSKKYVERLVENTQAKFHIECPVRSVVTLDEHVELETAEGVRQFDHVVFGCHSDQALAMRGDNATSAETEILGAFPYQANTAVLHTDENALPHSRRAWACWNYFLPWRESRSATVTYNMNLLQSLDTEATYCVTLNDSYRVDPDRVIQSIEYHHPVFTSQRTAAQLRHSELIDTNRLSYCGAYWGNGFHEDGVNSALAVVNKLEAAVCMEGHHA